MAPITSRQQQVCLSDIFDVAFGGNIGTHMAIVTRVFPDVDDRVEMVYGQTNHGPHPDPHIARVYVPNTQIHSVEWYAFNRRLVTDTHFRLDTVGTVEVSLISGLKIGMAPHVPTLQGLWRVRDESLRQGLARLFTQSALPQPLPAKP